MTQLESFASEAAEPARFTAEEFSRMVDADAFGDRAVELVHGEIIELSPAYSPHAQMMGKIYARLLPHFGENRLYIDCYIRLDGDSVRAFDVTVLDDGVVPDKMLDPRNVTLGVEVAYSSAPRDLGEKMLHYAAAGIRAYMVVEIELRLVHLMTGPGPNGFADHRKFAFGAPIELPEGGTFVID
jgi:Uma2 family endonuclease